MNMIKLKEGKKNISKKNKNIQKMEWLNFKI